YQEDREGWKACRHALGELAGLARTGGFQLRIAIVPELHSLGKNYEFKDVHAMIQKIGKQEGVPVIDLLEAFPEENPESFWVSPGDAHPNVPANQLMATALYAIFQKPGWYRSRVLYSQK